MFLRSIEEGVTGFSGSIHQKIMSFFMPCVHRNLFFRILSLSLLAAFAINLSAASPAFAKANPRYASIVMDADTGMVLHSQHADKKRHPASLTKMMTLLMTFDALKDGRLRLKDRIRISRHAASMVPSKLDLPAGSSIRVKDAIEALVTKSANDIAVALAERLGGTENRFALQMTHRAKEIGMMNTYFKNASGLHHPDQVSTARDMAKMGRYLINNYPEYYRYFSLQQFTYNGKTYKNHNKMLSTYEGLDGIKTGYINASGFNLVASAKRGNDRIIGVVFGGRTSKTRNNHMKELLDHGFSKMHKVQKANHHAPLPDRKPVQESLKYASLKTSLSKNAFQQFLGEGDFDPALSSRFETGLLAIAAHTGRNRTVVTNRNTPSARNYIKVSRPAAKKHLSENEAHQTIAGPVVRNWSIQIGAWKERDFTNRILKRAQYKLPGDLLAITQPKIAPLKTRQHGWVFRARFSGYTKEQAERACTYFKDCMTISPGAARL